MKRKTSLVEFLRNSPLADAELNLERIRDEPEEKNLEPLFYDFPVDEENSAINPSNVCKSIFKPRPI